MYIVLAKIKARPIYKKKIYFLPDTKFLTGQFAEISFDNTNFFHLLVIWYQSLIERMSSL